MRQVLNRNSLLVVGLVGVVVALAATPLVGSSAAISLALALAGAATLAWIRLRGGASPVSWSQVEAAIGSGLPCLLFVYSDT